MESHQKASAHQDEVPFLPDFCSARVVLAVVLLAQLVAIVLALAGYQSSGDFWDNLGRISLFLLWCALLSSGLLCWTRRLLAARGPLTTSVAALAIVLGAVTVVSLGAWWMSGNWHALPVPLAGGARPLGEFMAANLLIAAIVTGLLLRYFWVTAQWRRNVREEARSRVLALQARIRPHFLFNTMNTIAALTRREPARAEEALEDLADLFRASLSDAAGSVTLKEELELSRTYQRIEQHRLGDRLQVEWRIGRLPLRTRVPALSVQPLLENAIYHGIEPLPSGGKVVITGRCEDGVIELSIENPLAAESTRRLSQREGHRIALDNLRQRFALAWGARASVEAGPAGDRYRVVLRFPAESEA